MSIYFIDGKAPLSIEGQRDIERNDPSINGEHVGSYQAEFKLSMEDFNRLFFSNCEIEYVSNYCYSNQIALRVVTHPYETNTCFEKAELLGPCDPLNIIKALYFEYSEDNSLYAVIIPETGCFVDRARLKDVLGLAGDGFLKKSNILPRFMSLGTCSPFITPKDLKIYGGMVEKIVFDSEALLAKREEQNFDDFSFGLDHRMSLQVNYWSCFEMLRSLFQAVVAEADILNLSFKEKLIRANGKINISYEFRSLNYRTAKFINSIHGHGDVSVVNDYSDEFNLPRILSAKSKGLPVSPSQSGAV